MAEAGRDGQTGRGQTVDLALLTARLAWWEGHRLDGDLGEHCKNKPPCY